MLPYYLVNGYDVIPSSFELKEEFEDDELDKICYYLGTNMDDMRSTE